jgi:hypothetical protein
MGTRQTNGHLPEDDPVPYRALRAVAVDDGVVAREDLIERDTDSGAVVEDPGAHEGGTYTALPSGTYNDVLQHIEDTYDVDPGRDPISGTGGDGDGDPEEHRSDPTDPTAHPVDIEWSLTGSSRA